VILIAEDDAQANTDHISAHRTVTLVVSPWAKRGAVVPTLTSTASVTKTVDELLGIGPSSLGDVLATDLRDYFTTHPDFTPYEAVAFTDPSATVTPAGERITALGSRLDMSSPDADSFRQAAIAELALRADRLTHRRSRMSRREYEHRQGRLYARALAIVGAEPTEDRDGG
jgi:hypothetical protein